MVGGYLSLLCSISDEPLKNWGKQRSSTGYIHKILDLDLSENVVELRDSNCNRYENTSIFCPADSHQLLNVKLPLLVIIIKNVDAKCHFRLQVIDSNKNRHHFLFYNAKFENPRNMRIPITQCVEVKFDLEWNELKLDLSQLTRQAFQMNYEATQRLEICGNCCLRRVYFIDRNYAKHEMSAELCKQFFDFYMLKWGIRVVERATQTERPDRKTGTVKKSQVVSILHTVACSDDSFDIENIDDINDENPEYTLAKIDLNFLKVMRAKCRNKIDEFFNVGPRTICCVKNPKFQALSMLRSERQKVLLASINFFNDIRNMRFPFKVDKNRKMRKNNQRTRGITKTLSHTKDSYEPAIKTNETAVTQVN